MLDWTGSVDMMTAYDWFNFSSYAVINIGAIIAATVFGWWYFVKLRRSRTALREFIGSVALAKLNLWGWSAMNMWSITFRDTDPPIETIPFRLLWLAVIYMQVRSITRVRPAQSADMIADMITANKTNRILVLEDDPDVSEIYRLALTDFGYDVVIAGTGSYALSVMDWQMPKVCVVDIKLPDMTGYEFMRRARLKGYTGPAIAVSGMEPPTIIGFNKFLLKPFRPAEIVAAVEEFIDRTGTLESHKAVGEGEGGATRVADRL